MTGVQTCALPIFAVAILHVAPTVGDAGSLLQVANFGFALRQATLIGGIARRRVPRRRTRGLLFLLFKLFDQLKGMICLFNFFIGYYQHSANDMPRRHFHNRFIKDYKQWASSYIDFVHYTLPL